MIALITESTPAADRALLHRAGWSTQTIRAISNPNAHHAARLDYIYTKLQIWDMVDYDRIVYLDADTQVFANIDELCSAAATVSASLRGPFFNAGVMVVTPSHQFFETMTAIIDNTPSYTGGDQGFLNTLFYDFQRCKYYDPRLDQKAMIAGNFTVPPMDSLPGSVLPPDTTFTCLRLPSRYNGDLGIAIARGGQWVLEPFMQESYPAVLHYTLAFMKPWQWWSYPIVIDHWQWWHTFALHSGTAIFRWSAAFVFALFVVIYWAFVRDRVASRRVMAKGSCQHLIGRCPARCAPTTHHLSRCKLLIIFELGNVAALLTAWFLSNLFLIHPFANAAILVAYYLSFSDLFLQLIVLPYIDHYGLNTQEEDRLISNYQRVALFGLSALMAFLMLNYINIFLSVIAFILFVVPFIIFQTWFILSLASVNDQETILK